MTLLISFILCWLIPTLVGLICGILGYLLGRLLCKNNEDTTDNTEYLEDYKNRISKLETDLVACEANKISNSSRATAISSFAAGAVFNKEAAKAVFGKSIKQDDLTVVEGIGPKIKELFHNHNITTWTELANCTIEKCQEVLNSGGKRFDIHNPRTWPEQAKLAANGKWEKLKIWQDELDGGK